jgi:hypothetical protein
MFVVPGMGGLFLLAYALTLLCGVGGWTVQGFEHFENLMQRLFVLSILHNFLKYSKKKAL